MRAIDPLLQADLDGGATTMCRCWRLRRRDGVVLGFTDHDRPLRFDGTEFRAESGMDASALQTSNGLAVANAQASGALSSDAICEDDIKAGRYDRAEIDHWLVDWRHPERRVHLFRGHIGEIRRTAHSFEAELRGLADALNVPVGRIIKRSCDRIVGDASCRVDLGDPRFRHQSTVASVGSDGLIRCSEAGTFPQGWFTGGVLSWLGGRNEGLRAVVREDRLQKGIRVIRLATEPALAVAASDGFVLTAGCDKTADTCRTKFSNFLNFRGFPHIPGEDWVVAYPKGGENHDGSSLRRG